MRKLYWLVDEAWSKIEPHLPRVRRGADRVDDRRMISGIVHMLQSGARWRDWAPRDLQVITPPDPNRRTPFVLWGNLIDPWLQEELGLWACPNVRRAHRAQSRRASLGAVKMNNRTKYSYVGLNPLASAQWPQRGPEDYLNEQSSLAMCWGLDRQMEGRRLAEAGGSPANVVGAGRREGSCMSGHVAG